MNASNPNGIISNYTLSSMQAEQPYLQLVSDYARLKSEGASFSLGGFHPLPKPVIEEKNGCALIFSPHPDDECIIGALPYRLLHQGQMRVINVAVTQGSRKDRQQERWQELQGACRYIGYDVIQTTPNGLESVTLKTRSEYPDSWKSKAETIVELLEQYEPRMVFFPHAGDWNGTHIGVHWLLMDALKEWKPSRTIDVIETEYWGAMETPNLMVELDVAGVASLVTGTSFHAGEVRRNPFHILLPAWMQDNVRRGSELVGEQGGRAPDFPFATLYRFSRWKDGQLRPVLEKGRTLPMSENPLVLLTI